MGSVKKLIRRNLNHVGVIEEELNRKRGNETLGKGDKKDEKEICG